MADVRKSRTFVIRYHCYDPISVSTVSINQVLSDFMPPLSRAG